MAKLTEYPQATTFDANDIFIKDGTGGTKKITIEDVVKFIIKYPNANLAPDYSASSTYIKNELVIHDGELYKAKDNIETAEAWNSAHWEKTKISIALSQLDEDIRAELENKANIDGSYIDLTAGASHQLISAVTIEDQVPYNFRTSGGSVDIGDRETDMIVGGTVAWNQKMTNGNFVNTTGIDVNSHFNTMAVANNILTVTVTAVGTSGNQIAFYRTGIPSKAGHKMLFSYFANPSKETRIRIGATSAAAGNYNLSGVSVVANEWNHIQQIGLVASGNSGNILYFYYNINSQLSINDTVQFKNVTAFDLTQMFGATIADYIYSLEQANAGDGVAWFKKLFPNDYYAYDAGTLRSVQTSAHKMIGFNAWDEEWERGSYASASGAKSTDSSRIRSKNYIPVIPGQSYYLKVPGSANLFLYDKNKNYLRYRAATNSVVQLDENAHYVTFSVGSSFAPITTYNHDICLNLSWDGERDGEYEPYQAWNYPLDDSLTLRGVPTLDANNKLRYDGDTYESDGTVTRRFASVDMGTLAWSYNSTDSVYVHVTDRKSGSQLGVCTGLIQVAANTGVGNMAYGTYKLYGTSDSVAVKVEGITVDNASEKLSGMYLLYELATPITETADPYTNPQIVDDFGTEEYVDAGVEAGTRDVVIPVGHETLYYPNLRAKLEMAPNSPDGDGDYIVRQINGQNTYVPFSDAEALDNKANVEGEYDDLTSGQSKQLVSKIGITDQAPYNFRTSGGSIDIGDRETDMVVGGTLAWNQLIKNGNFDNGTTNWGGSKGTVAASNNVLTYTCSSDIDSNGRIYQASNIPKLAGHKILLSMYVNPSVATRVHFGATSASTGVYNVSPVDVSANAWTHVIQLGSVGDNNTATAIYIYLNRTSVLVENDTVQIKNVTAFDLTQMFGVTIADYIYSLEQSSAGSGVAWFKKLFPNDYYAYDAGTLRSVQTSAHKMVGFNLFDKTAITDGYYLSTTTGEPEEAAAYYITDYIRVMKDVPVRIPASGTVRRWFYDMGKIASVYINSTQAQTYVPPDDGYIRVSFKTADYPADSVCIHLAWDGERDGEYEPYQAWNYPLDDSLTLRGVPTLDANNKLRYDGDTYESDGTVTRRYGIVDLGSLVWYPSSVEGRYTASVDGKKPGLNNFIQAKYSVGNTYAAENDKVISGNDSRSTFSIKDTSAATAEELKTSLSGVYLVYELETPTAESAAPYTNPQIVDDFGTEEYVDAGVEAGTRDVAIPVGHETFYQANLRAKLEMAPNSPDGGESQYVVYHDAEGNNTYVPLIIPKEIPDIPNEAGTYNLRLVVDSHGQFDMTWIPEA